MARWSILFSKKRGERRTGSSALGGAALGLFSAVFLAAGVIALAFIVVDFSIPEWRVNHHFVETTGRVVAAYTGSDDAGLKRPEFDLAYSADGKELVARTTYDIAGTYLADEGRTERILAQFPVGEEFPCWYDPHDPGTVVLARGYTWFSWLMLLLPVAFISIGGGGLLYTLLTWGKSSERIAATAQNKAGLDFFLPAHGAPENPFPNVPDPRALGDSPGTFLAHRLPPGTGGWSLAATAILCVLWNVTVAFFLRMVVSDFRAGQPDWLLTLFVVVSGLVGLLFLALLGRALWIAVGVGTTLVEISAHPLVPGRKYDLYMSQAGRSPVHTLEVQLICEESATYRQGTNTRKAIRRVYEQTLIERHALPNGQGQPFEARALVEIPAEAMHSFKAVHNRIDWKIVVKGSVPRWPAFERVFPVVVLPQENAEGGEA